MAALKLGWDAIMPEFPDITLTFFGATSMRMADLEVSGGFLKPANAELRKMLKKTSGAGARIGGGYDRYIICGLRYYIGWIAEMHENFRIESEPQDDRQPLSRSCFSASVKEGLEQSLAIQTIKKLKKITHAPIGLITTPFISDHGQNYWNFIKATETRNTVLAECKKVSDKLEARLGITIFSQPQATLCGPTNTQRKYSKGAVRLLGSRKEHGADDIYHMNADFGALTLREIFSSGW